VEGVEVVNTVGAGDAFASGFLYGVINSMDTKACLEMGAKTAAKIVGIFEPY
jgi:fructoselysine 6-kinase